MFPCLFPQAWPSKIECPPLRYSSLGADNGPPFDAFAEPDLHNTWINYLNTHHEQSAPFEKQSKLHSAIRHVCPRLSCSSTFARPADLLRHLRSVHGPKQRCSHLGCQYRSGRSDKLKEHYRKKHCPLSVGEQLFPIDSNPRRACEFPRSFLFSILT